MSTLTQSIREPPEKEPVFEALQARVAAAEAALLEASEPDAVWTCCHCGHTMPSPGRNWLNPQELREQAGEPRDGTVLSIALMQLIKKGVFELGADLKVRRADET